MNRNILFLYRLSRLLKDRNDKVSMSSSELGDSLGISQQSASRYLNELEAEGLIARSKSGRTQGVMLTQKGFAQLGEMYLDLKDFIEEKKPENKITGTIVRGLGEGAYYVREYAEEIKKKLGMRPFYGTLNIKPAEKMANTDRLMTGTIKGFKRGGRTFGSLRYAKVSLSSGSSQERCYVIVPARTHHKDALEIISQHNLRDKMGLVDGASVTVEFTG